MKAFIKHIFDTCKKHKKKIIFPESSDPRILKAAEIIIRKNIATPILLGNAATILKQAERLKIRLNQKKISIVDPSDKIKVQAFAEQLFEIRKNKGLTQKEAEEKLKNPNYFGTMMLYNNEADGMVTGCTESTGAAIRPALEILKSQNSFHRVSGLFFMLSPKSLLLFADCALNIDPSAEELAEIAQDTVLTAKNFKLTPRVAFLSFSTKSSATHPSITKIAEASKIFKKNNPKIPADGEMQVDSAIVPEVAKRKAPKSEIQGNANILIFPDLNSGNIAYKLVERLGKTTAIGPILQGLSKPVNDLSRGCNYNDIVNITAFTVYDTLKTKKN